VDERALPSIDSGREACVGKLTARVGTPPIGSMASLGDDTLRLASAALASSICMFASAGATPWRVGVGILGCSCCVSFLGQCVLWERKAAFQKAKVSNFPTTIATALSNSLGHLFLCLVAHLSSCRWPPRGPVIDRGARPFTAGRRASSGADVFGAGGRSAAT
jgi:hypothetical protein